jgi:hypothetical protein
MQPTEQPIDREDYERIWDELIACRDQLADARLRAIDAANALKLCHNLFPFLALKDEDKSQRIFRKGFTSSFARAEKNIIRIIED